jgi:hypothetical protein
VSRVSNLSLQKLIHPARRQLAVKLSVEKIVKCRAISVSQKPGVEPTQKLAAKARPHGLYGTAGGLPEHRTKVAKTLTAGQPLKTLSTQPFATATTSAAADARSLRRIMCSAGGYARLIGGRGAASGR